MESDYETMNRIGQHAHVAGRSKEKKTLVDVTR